MTVVPAKTVECDGCGGRLLVDAGTVGSARHEAQKRGWKTSTTGAPARDFCSACVFMGDEVDSR